MRTGLHITEHDFPEIYTWLEFFAQNYDNAAKEVQIVLHGIVEAYMEKRADEHRVITEEEAIAFLKARDSNPRNAGRKPKYSEDEQARMISLLETGTEKTTVAEQFKCSVNLRLVHTGSKQ